MELGEKLRQARMEAGLSQRALCGEEITRNMLSRIENGAARPSMGTLQYLAARLGKPVSYFLEETAVCSPNQAVMAEARQLFDEGDFAGAKQALSGYRAPDETYDRERQLLEAVTALNLAEQAIGEGKEPYARELLETAAETIGNAPYCGKELERRRLLLLYRSGACVTLPNMDEALLLRGQDALSRGETERAAHLLEAAEDHAAPRWRLLMGQVYMARKEYAEAARCLQAVETVYPKQTIPNLEICFRELGDYKNAYFYVLRQKKT